MKGLKKRITLIAAALTSAFVISAASVPAMADTTEQYVTVEDGVTVGIKYIPRLDRGAGCYLVRCQRNQICQHD